MKKDVFVKILSLILILAGLITTLPLTVLAEEISGEAPDGESEKSEDEASEVYVKSIKLEEAVESTEAKAALEADGYIERSKCKNGGDTRLNEIYVTESGKRIAEETEKTFLQVDASALEGFSEDETKLFVSMLEKIQSNLNRIGDTDTAEAQRKEMETKK